MYAFGLRIDIFGQSIGIGALELAELAPVDDLARQFMALGSEILKHLGGCRPLPALGLGTARQAHATEQDFSQLFRRTDVERFAGKFMDFMFERRGALRQFTG